MAPRTRVRISDASYAAIRALGSRTARSAVGQHRLVERARRRRSGDVDSMVLMRTMVRPRRFSSVPTLAARSASDGSQPSSRRSASRAASSSRRWRRTPRGQASLRSASIMAPRTRRSAKVSNLMPRPRRSDGRRRSGRSCRPAPGRQCRSSAASTPPCGGQAPRRTAGWRRFDCGVTASTVRYGACRLRLPVGRALSRRQVDGSLSSNRGTSTACAVRQRGKPTER